MYVQFTVKGCLQLKRPHENSTRTTFVHCSAKWQRGQHFILTASQHRHRKWKSRVSPPKRSSPVEYRQPIYSYTTHNQPLVVHAALPALVQRSVAAATPLVVYYLFRPLPPSTLLSGVPPNVAASPNPLCTTHLIPPTALIIHIPYRVRTRQIVEQHVWQRGPAPLQIVTGRRSSESILVSAPPNPPSVALSR